MTDNRPHYNQRILTRMRAAFLVLAWLGVSSTAAAQMLPAEPMTFGGGRVVIGGEVSGSIAPDDPGFFNFSDYEHSTLREFRAALSASLRANDHVSVLGEIRTENFQDLTPFAFYVRVRPWRDKRFDIQLGRIPPTFGSFTRYAYGHLNPLIGYPLAYQYLTSLRTDSIPATAEELLRMRGRGWLSNFSIGNLEPARGLPLVTAFSWDTGVQVSTGWRIVDVTAAVTNGSASNPRVSDDNDGKQFATRVTVRPAFGLVLGASYARGQFGERTLVDALPAESNRRFMQQAVGADAEYSRDHWSVRFEGVMSEWRIPAVAAPFVPPALRAFSPRVEGRYTFLPGMYAAARVDYLGFNRIAAGSRIAEWDAPVTRVEVGGGYYLQKNLVARFAIQMNRREGGRVRTSTLPAFQLLYWF
jgi:hypothetical protein